MKKRRMKARYMLFALGAALGSALGLILGSLLTFWIGEGTLRAVQRILRKITGSDDQPNFEMLLQ
jgi:membrane protein YqaA with SNARE-associated domain